MEQVTVDEKAIKAELDAIMAAKADELRAEARARAVAKAEAEANAKLELARAAADAKAAEAARKSRGAALIRFADLFAKYLVDTGNTNPGSVPAGIVDALKREAGL